MKKTLLLCLALASTVALLNAKNPPKSADFSGNWVMETDQTKNLPQGLESYRMAIKQTGEQLGVQTTLKGDLRPMGNLPNIPNGPNGGGQGPGSTGRYPNTAPGGYPGGMGGGMGMPRVGGMGMPGGRAGGPMSEGIPGSTMPRGGGGEGRRPGGGRSQAIAAFKLYPSNAVYKLDGSESTAKLGGSAHSGASLKANWEKGGKQLKLSLTGDDDSDRRGEQIQLKDVLKLSKDGQTLKVDRTVRTARGSSTLHLVFHKEGSAPASSPAA
ncbi:MAG: hypothetical protein ACRD2O_00970 [Terriglobia bacterium]